MSNVSCCAGKIRRGRAALGALVFLAAFLYGFWRVGKLWPGVPLPTDGIFRLKQVATTQLPVLSFLAAHDAATSSTAACLCPSFRRFTHLHPQAGDGNAEELRAL